jgi:hypothetical protein
MLSFETLEQMDAAFEKARKKAISANPLIRVISTGRYQVASSQPGKSYDVYCGRTEQGLFFIACSCRAGLEGKACYHGSAASIRHQVIRAGEIAKQKRHDEENSLYSKPEKESEKIGGFRV